MSRPPRPRLLVIDPSVAYPEEECVATVLDGWPGEAQVLLPALRPGDGPGRGSDYDVDGIVVLGSRASVHDDRPWLRELGAWLSPVLEGEKRIPLLGICFGHQLIAERAGGEVGLMNGDGSTELGIRETVLEGGRLVPGRRILRVVASHKEAVKTAPRGYKIVARRERVPVDGLEHESLPIFGFQFHPEARESFLEARGFEGLQMDPTMIAGSEELLSAFRRLALSRS